MSHSVLGSATQPFETASPSSGDAVTFQGVSRRFGSVIGVDRLDLSVPRGVVTVLLGANGAGKTTSLRLTTGVLRRDEGTIAVFGMDPEEEGESIRRRFGVVSPNQPCTTG